MKGNIEYYNDLMSYWGQWPKTNNMETKKKINWLKIWQIVRDLLVAILTAKEGAEML